MHFFHQKVRFFLKDNVSRETPNLNHYMYDLFCFTWNTSKKIYFIKNFVDVSCETIWFCNKPTILSVVSRETTVFLLKNSKNIDKAKQL